MSAPVLAVWSFWPQYAKYAPPGRMPEIARFVAARHGIEVERLFRPVSGGKARDAKFEFMARAAAAGKSQSAIARFLGLKDHTSVWHGIRRYYGAPARGWR